MYRLTGLFAAEAHTSVPPRLPPVGALQMTGLQWSWEPTNHGVILSFPFAPSCLSPISSVACVLLLLTSENTFST